MMARIPIFFQSTFPVETYGALHDPNAESVAARAKVGLEANRLQNSESMLNTLLSLGRGVTPVRGGGIRLGRSGGNASFSMDTSFGGGAGRTGTSDYVAEVRKPSGNGGGSSGPVTPVTYRINPKE